MDPVVKDVWEEWHVLYNYQTRQSGLPGTLEEHLIRLLIGIDRLLQRKTTTPATDQVLANVLGLFVRLPVRDAATAAAVRLQTHVDTSGKGDKRKTMSSSSSSSSSNKRLHCVREEKEDMEEKVKEQTTQMIVSRVTPREQDEMRQFVRDALQFVLRELTTDMFFDYLTRADHVRMLQVKRNWLVMDVSGARALGIHILQQTHRGPARQGLVVPIHHGFGQDPRLHTLRARWLETFDLSAPMCTHGVEPDNGYMYGFRLYIQNFVLSSMEIVAWENTDFQVGDLSNPHDPLSTRIGPMDTLIYAGDDGPEPDRHYEIYFAKRHCTVGDVFEIARVLVETMSPNVDPPQTHIWASGEQEGTFEPLRKVDLPEARIKFQHVFEAMVVYSKIDTKWMGRADIPITRRPEGTSAYSIWFSRLALASLTTIKKRIRSFMQPYHMASRTQKESIRQTRRERAGFVAQCYLAMYLDESDEPTEEDRVRYPTSDERERIVDRVRNVMTEQEPIVTAEQFPSIFQTIQFEAQRTLFADDQSANGVDWLLFVMYGMGCFIEREWDEYGTIEFLTLSAFLRMRTCTSTVWAMIAGGLHTGMLQRFVRHWATMTSERRPSFRQLHARSEMPFPSRSNSAWQQWFAGVWNGPLPMPEVVEDHMNDTRDFMINICGVKRVWPFLPSTRSHMDEPWFLRYLFSDPSTGNEEWERLFSRNMFRMVGWFEAMKEEVQQHPDESIPLSMWTDVAMSHMDDVVYTRNRDAFKWIRASGYCYNTPMMQFTGYQNRFIRTIEDITTHKACDGYSILLDSVLLMTNDEAESPQLPDVLARMYQRFFTATGTWQRTMVFIWPVLWVAWAVENAERNRHTFEHNIQIIDYFYTHEGIRRLAMHNTHLCNTSEWLRGLAAVANVVRDHPRYSHGVYSRLTPNIEWGDHLISYGRNHSNALVTWSNPYSFAFALMYLPIQLANRSTGTCGPNPLDVLRMWQDTAIGSILPERDPSLWWGAKLDRKSCFRDAFLKTHLPEKPRAQATIVVSALVTVLSAHLEPARRADMENTVFYDMIQEVVNALEGYINRSIHMEPDPVIQRHVLDIPSLVIYTESMFFELLAESFCFYDSALWNRVFNRMLTFPVLPALDSNPMPDEWWMLESARRRGDEVDYPDSSDPVNATLSRRQFWLWDGHEPNVHEQLFLAYGETHIDTAQDAEQQIANYDRFRLSYFSNQRQQQMDAAGLSFQGRPQLIVNRETKLPWISYALNKVMGLPVSQPAPFSMPTESSQLLQLEYTPFELERRAYSTNEKEEDVPPSDPPYYPQGSPVRNPSPAYNPPPSPRRTPSPAYHPTSPEPEMDEASEPEEAEEPDLEWE